MLDPFFGLCILNYSENNFGALSFQLFDLFGYVNLREAVCSPEDLGRYLLFRSEAEGRQVSRELCAIDIDQIPHITDTIQKHIDVQSLLKIVRKDPIYLIMQPFKA